MVERMRLRRVVAIALLAMPAALVGSAALAAHTNAAAAHVADEAGFALQAPHVTGSTFAAPVPTSSLHRAFPLVVLACAALMLLLASWFATDASLRMPEFALLRSTPRRRAPPILRV
jgi:uncharacterized membrane protein YfcA